MTLNAVEGLKGNDPDHAICTVWLPKTLGHSFIHSFVQHLLFTCDEPGAMLELEGRDEGVVSSAPIQHKTK